MPTSESGYKLRKKRFIQKRAAEREARILGKSEAITPNLVAEMASIFFEKVDMFGCSPTLVEADELAETLATEHGYFENAMSPVDLEQFSRQTIVGIGRYQNKDYVLVLNELKVLGGGVPGLGFPGGRVRLGESPDVRLQKEFLEETGLRCEVLDPSPVAEHRVGEEEHRFSAYEIKIVGGKPQANPTKDEPITEIVFLDEETLKRACQSDGRVRVKIGKQERIVGILRNHRIAFLEYLRKRDAVKPAVPKGVANV